MTGTLTILNRIRERIVNGDWRNHMVQGGYSEGPGCLLQLCSQEADKADVYSGTIISAACIAIVGPVISWNDHPDRKPEEVIAVLNHAITLAKEEGPAVGRGEMGIFEGYGE